jgi:hypothetical protein
MMPFQSKAQWRAGFSGKIPGMTKEKAHEWADETDWDGLPDDKFGKTSSLMSQAAYSARVMLERKRRQKTSELFAKMAYALAETGKVREDSSRNIGGFSGKVTENFLKAAPGITASSQPVNPNRSLASAKNTY